MAIQISNSEKMQLYSGRLSSALLQNGVTNRCLLIKRSYAHIYEAAHYCLSPKQEQLLRSGSSVEQSTLVSSDIDSMFVVDNITVVADESMVDSSDCKRYTFLMETTNVRPGFAKLRLLRDSKEWFRVNNAVSKGLVCSENGLIYFSSSAFLGHKLSSREQDACWKRFKRVYIHGPCITEAYDTEKGELEVDNAFGISCNTWPQNSLEWFARKRSKNWPDKEYIEKVKRMPCYLLPVGDSDLEWRFAFVPAERELIWSFNDCQIQCLKVLKMVKATYLKEYTQDDLSSFHFKTIIFWLIEEHGENIWIKKNLICCVVLCLERLQQCIASAALPHYFLTERNLLYGKFADKKLKKKTIEEITAILKEPIRYICNADENVRREIIDISKWSNTKQMEKCKIMLQRVEEEELAVQIQQCFGVLCFVASCHVSVENYDKLRKQLRDLHGDRVKSIRESIEAFLNIRQGIQYLRYYIEYERIPNPTTTRDIVAKSAVKYLINGKTLDLMSGELYLLTALLHVNPYGTDFVLQYLQEHCFKSEVIYYCGYYGHKHIISKTAARVKEKVELKPVFTFDVIFTEKEKYFIPAGAGYERNLFIRKDFYYIHPVLYAHYLHFAVGKVKGDAALQERALADLEKVIQNIENQGSKRFWEIMYRAYNLLGFCYMKFGNKERACRCFVSSLRHKWCDNVAAYHIAVILNSFINRTRTIYTRM